MTTIKEPRRHDGQVEPRRDLGGLHSAAPRSSMRFTAYDGSSAGAEDAHWGWTC